MYVLCVLYVHTYVYVRTGFSHVTRRRRRFGFGHGGRGMVDSCFFRGFPETSLTKRLSFLNSWRSNPLGECVHKIPGADAGFRPSLSQRSKSSAVVTTRQHLRVSFPAPSVETEAAACGQRAQGASRGICQGPETVRLDKLVVRRGMHVAGGLRNSLYRRATTQHSLPLLSCKLYTT